VPFLLLLATTPLLSAAGYFLRLSWLLPLLQVLPAYPVMVLDLKRGRIGAAVGHMLAWAALLALTVGTLTTFAPSAGEAAVLHGAAYRDEMLGWVRTGEGKESSPARFLPEHAVHLAAFTVLALASGGLLALLMGAVLMNYMSFYVGSLLAIARTPSTVLLYGWPPWAALRVIGFVILGLVLAVPLLRRLTEIPLAPDRRRAWMAMAFACILLDAVLKAILAPRWSGILRAALFPLSPGF
jgi:hypothetical protein